MKTAQHWDRLPKNQPAEITMFQISEVQEAPAFNGRRSFLTLRAADVVALFPFLYPTRLTKDQLAEIAMLQISEVQEAPAFNGRRSFLALRATSADCHVATSVAYRSLCQPSKLSNTFVLGRYEPIYQTRKCGMTRFERVWDYEDKLLRNWHR
jgi:hypothetical protein